MPLSLFRSQGALASSMSVYVRNLKKCMGILKSLNMVNLRRGVSMLKLKINFHLPELLCIVVSAAENGQF